MHDVQRTISIRLASSLTPTRRGSLKALFVAGERADPDTVEFFERTLNVPVVDHWWQTESGAPMCGMQLDEVGTVPGSCGLPLPGFDMRVLDGRGEDVENGEMGSIAIKLPLPPGFMTTVLGSHERYVEGYLTEVRCCEERSEATACLTPLPFLTS